MQTPPGPPTTVQTKQRFWLNVILGTLTSGMLGVYALVSFGRLLGPSVVAGMVEGASVSQAHAPSEPSRQPAPVTLTDIDRQIDNGCREASRKRGTLDDAQFEYCRQRSREAVSRLTEMNDTVGTEKWFAHYAVVDCYSSWTKQGLTDLRQLAYCLNKQREAVLALRYASEQGTLDRNLAGRCFAHWLTHKSAMGSLALTEHCVRKNAPPQSDPGIDQQDQLMSALRDRVAERALVVVLDEERNREPGKDPETIAQDDAQSGGYKGVRWGTSRVSLAETLRLALHDEGHIPRLPGIPTQKAMFAILGGPLNHPVTDFWYPSKTPDGLQYYTAGTNELERTWYVFYLDRLYGVAVSMTAQNLDEYVSQFSAKYGEPEKQTFKFDFPRGGPMGETFFSTIYTWREADTFIRLLHERPDTWIPQLVGWRSSVTIEGELRSALAEAVTAKEREKANAKQERATKELQGLGVSPLAPPK